MSSDTIDRETVEQRLRDADSELDSAVEHGKREQELYWLGRKEELKDLLEEFDQ